MAGAASRVAMPASLQELLQLQQCTPPSTDANAAGNVAATLSSSSPTTATAAAAATHSPPLSGAVSMTLQQQPVPTTQLLQQVDVLYAHYVHLVEDVARCLPHDGNSSNSSSSSRHNAQAVAATLRELHACAATLQTAMRSKVHQTVRLELLQHLRSELAQREQAATRMEAVVQLARSTLQQQQQQQQHDDNDTMTMA